MRTFITPILVVLLFFGCVKDEQETVSEPKKELSVEYIDINQLNAELSILKPIVQTHEMLTRNFGDSKKIRAIENKIDPLKDVLVVYEEEKPLSYSISFKNQSIERFANVVVVKDENDNSQTMVIEYAPDAESIRLYNTGRIGIDELSGTMYVYGSLEDYINETQRTEQSQPSGKSPLFFSDPCSNVFNFNFGNGSLSGGGSGGSTESCEIIKIVIPCVYGGTGEHGSSACGPDGTGPGSTTIIEYQCTRIYTSNMGGTLANFINAILPIGPCGSSVSPRGNIGVNAQFKPATPCFDEAICAKADALIDALDAELDTPLTKTQKKRIYEGGTFFKFAEAALVALENGGEVDFEEMYILTETVDDNYVYQGPKQKIPSSIKLSNGDVVNITFITHTSDNKSSNQQVAVELVNSIKFALEQANSNLSASDKITSINIYATTNGKHGTYSNHSHGSAIDINSINGTKMAITGLTNQIRELQKGFDNFQYIRENFGPYFKYKFSKESPVGSQWNYNYPVSGHKDHIHISIRK